MKFGFDFHNVITTQPRFYAEFMSKLINHKHEVHIITGAMKKTFKKEWAVISDQLLRYTHFYSISDDLIARGYKHYFQDEDNPWFEDTLAWNMAKGVYCREHEIDVHFDDNDKYKPGFKTFFIPVKG